MNTYIQYIVKGQNTKIEGNNIKVSYNSTSKTVSFYEVKEEILKNFILLKTNEEIAKFINEYGNIFKEKVGTIRIERIKSEVNILNNIFRMITILQETNEAYDLMEKINNLDLEFLDIIIKDYMQQIGKMNEYDKEIFWKEDKYKAGNAIKEIQLIINNKYEVEKDNNKEYIFVGNYGIPLYDLKQDIYYILNTLMARILSNVELQIYYIEEEGSFKNKQNVNSLLEAMYIYVYNKLDTDNPIRHCNNPNCDKVLIGDNKRKIYCCDECRNKYNKKKGGKDPIQLLANSYKAKVYRAAKVGKINWNTAEDIYIKINEARNNLKKKQIEDIEEFQKVFDKIFKQYNIGTGAKEGK